jgi:hypothetical protein
VWTFPVAEDFTGTCNLVFVMLAGVNIVGAFIWALFASGERLVDW